MKYNAFLLILSDVLDESVGERQRDYPRLRYRSLCDSGGREAHRTAEQGEQRAHGRRNAGHTVERNGRARHDDRPCGDSL